MSRMAIAATRAMMAQGDLGGMHAGCIGFDRANCAYASGGKLPGAMAGTASLTLMTLIHRRRGVVYSRHRMCVAVT